MQQLTPEVKVLAHMKSCVSILVAGWIFALGSATVCAQNVDEAEIKRLVRDLASPTYAIRQTASERIWQLGDAAKPALQQAADEGDPEVANRAKEILSVLAMGISPETSPEVAKLVLRYHSNGRSVRKEILRHLIREDRFSLVFDLLAEEDPDNKSLFTEVMNVNDTIIRLGRVDRWDDIEQIVSHPLTFQQDRMMGVIYRLADGTLVEKLDELEKKIEVKEADGKKLTNEEVLQVIAIQRLLGKYDEAEKLTSKIKDTPARFSILHKLWMEQGRWSDLEQKMVDKEAAVKPEDGKIVANDNQLALVHSFTNNQSAYADLIKKVNAKHAQNLENKEDAAADTIRKKLIQIGMGTLDWSLIDNNLDLEDKSNTFDLLEFSRRSEKALELLEVGASIEERSVWFARRIRTIKSLRAKVIRLNEKDQDADEAEEELEEVWDLCFGVAQEIRDRGFEDEALLHYNSLFAAMEETESIHRRTAILSELVHLERNDAAWKMVEMGFTPNEYRQLIYTLFPYRTGAGSYWYGALTKRYPEPLQRLKAVSGLLNSSLGSIPGFDFEKELSQIEFDSSQNKTGYLDYRLHEIYLFHGQDDVSERYLDMAKQLKYSVVQRESALQSYEDGNFDEALEYFDEYWRSRSAPLEVLYAAKIYEKRGEKREALLRFCLAYAFWRDSYRNTSTIESLKRVNKISWIEPFINVDILAVHGKSVSNERYRNFAADTLEESDPKSSANQRRIALYNTFARESVSALPINYALSQNQIQMSLAKAAIQEKRFDDALARLRRINGFFPGDASTIEKLIGEMDEAGGTKQSDEIFREITGYYFEMISKYPDSPLYRNDYAWVCACSKRNTEHMLRHSELAVAKRPNFSNYLDTLAEIHFQLGNYEKAIELCRRCLQLWPDKPHYKDQLKKFRTAVGQVQQP